MTSLIWSSFSNGHDEVKNEDGVSTLFDHIDGAIPGQ
jgi:hypothetical protein